MKSPTSGYTSASSTKISTTTDESDLFCYSQNKFQPDFDFQNEDTDPKYLKVCSSDVVHDIGKKK